MQFNMEDLERGYKHCQCGLRFVLTAGTDYPPQAWKQCAKCDSFVVDDEKVAEIEQRFLSV